MQITEIITTENIETPEKYKTNNQSIYCTPEIDILH